MMVATATATALAAPARPRTYVKLSEHRGGVSTDRLAGRIVHGSYDAAQTNDENYKHWSAADALSANAAHVPAVRAIIRQRARYEFANNTYCRGMLTTLAYECVGIGPRLQILGIPKAAADAIERKFMRWARKVKLGEKLRTAVITQARDGETFVMRFTNPRINHPVKLDLRLFEGDQVATPDLSLSLSRRMLTDGIVFDAYGNPQTYHVLHQHPGETALFWATGSPLDYDEVAARNVYHMFRTDRPGQTRGVSEIASALPLFAQLRRYTLAVIAAAETAADFAGVIKSTLPTTVPDDDNAPLPMDQVELERRLLTVLPAGWDMGQMKSEQPATTYEMFKREIIKEAGRCLDMPYGTAGADHSKYNYASGQLDRKPFLRSVFIRRDSLEDLLEWVVNTWLEEASAIAGYLPIPDADENLEREFYWQTGEQHQDPARESEGQERKLRNLTTNLGSEWGKDGSDWQGGLRQRAMELKFIKELEQEFGVTMLAPEAGSAAAVAKRDDEEEEQIPEEDE